MFRIAPRGQQVFPARAPATISGGLLRRPHLNPASPIASRRKYPPRLPQGSKWNVALDSVPVSGEMQLLSKMNVLSPGCILIHPAAGIRVEARLSNVTRAISSTPAASASDAWIPSKLPNRPTVMPLMKRKPRLAMLNTPIT